MFKHWLRKYPNIVKDIFVNRPDQIWVNDIASVLITYGGHRK